MSSFYVLCTIGKVTHHACREVMCEKCLRLNCKIRRLLKENSMRAWLYPTRPRRLFSKRLWSGIKLTFDSWPIKKKRAYPGGRILLWPWCNSCCNNRHLCTETYLATQAEVKVSLIRLPSVLTVLTLGNSPTAACEHDNAYKCPTLWLQRGPA
jgi:hypothetical protein